VQPSTKFVSPDFILRLVVDKFDVCREDLTSSEDGAKKLRYARFAAMRFLNEDVANLRSEEVGRLLGGRSARDVEEGRKVMMRLMLADITIRNTIKSIQDEIYCEQTGTRIVISKHLPLHMRGK